MKTKLTLLLSFLLCLACNKDKNQTPTPITPPENLGVISSSQTDINSHQIVLLTVKNVELTDSVYSGTFGDKELSLYKSSDTSLVFLTPDLTTGKHFLKIEKAGNIAEFNVTQTDLLDTPDNTVKNLYTRFKLLSFQLDSLMKKNSNSIELLPADKLETIQILNQQMEMVVLEFNKLSNEQKIEEAKIIQANYKEIEMLIKIIEGIDKINIGMKNGRTLDTEIQILNVQDKMLLFSGISIVGLDILLSTLIGSNVDKFAKMTSWQAIADLIKGNGRKLGLVLIALSLKNAIYQTIGRAMDILGDKFISVLVKNGFITEQGNNKTKSEVFQNNTLGPLQIYVSKRTIQKNGVQEAQKKWIVDFVNTVESFNKFLDFFHFSLIQYVNLESDVSPEVSRLLRLAIDNPKVKGSVSGTRNNYQVKFSTDEKESQDFNYKIIYDDTEFKVESPLYAATLEVSGGKPVITSITTEVTTSTNQYGQTLYALWVVIEYEDEDGDMISSDGYGAKVNFCSSYAAKNYRYCGPARTIDNPDPHKGKFRDPKGTAEGSISNIKGQSGTWEYTIIDSKGNKSEPATVNIQ